MRTKAGYKTKIYVKVKQENVKYCIVDNYTAEELKQLGYEAGEITKMTKISLYDEIEVNPELE